MAGRQRQEELVGRNGGYDPNHGIVF
jgi:hypothetical protein